MVWNPYGRLRGRTAGFAFPAVPTDRGMVGVRIASRRVRLSFGPADMIFSGRFRLIFGTACRSSGYFRGMPRRPVFAVFRGLQERPSRAAFTGRLHGRRSHPAFIPVFSTSPSAGTYRVTVTLQKSSGGAICPCDLLSGILRKLVFRLLGRSERWRRPRVARSCKAGVAGQPAHRKFVRSHRRRPALGGEAFQDHRVFRRSFVFLASHCRCVYGG